MIPVASLFDRPRAPVSFAALEEGDAIVHRCIGRQLDEIEFIGPSIDPCPRLNRAVGRSRCAGFPPSGTRA